MIFWVKHIVFAVALIALGIYLVFFFKPSEINADKLKNDSETKANAAAQGLTNFYAELKREFDILNDPDRQQYVIELNSASHSLEDELAGLEEVSIPISGRWVGKTENRRFSAGTTLKTELSDIAKNQNMNLVWWLKRDFVVKRTFRVHETSLGTLFKIVTAIDSDFEMDVHGYFCPNQRSLVITDKKTDYLKRFCVLAGRRHLS